MTWFKCGGGGGGIPAILKSLMNSVFNKKFGTAEIYPPETWPDTVNLMGPLEEKTVSGSIVTFDDGSDDVPLKKCEVTIPANLTGVSSVDVVKTGRNLLEIDSSYDISTRATTLTRNYSNNVLHIYGEVQDTNSNYYSQDITDLVKEMGTITIIANTVSGGTADLSFCVNVQDENTVISRLSIGDTTRTITYTDGYTYLLMFFVSISATVGNTVDMTVNFEADYGSSVGAYTPYVQPTTHTATLGRTIYGGTADIVNGTGTDKNVIVPFSDCTWSVVTSYQSNFNADNGIISLRFGKNAMSTAGYAQTTDGVVCNVFSNNNRSVWNNASRLNEIGFTDGITVNILYSDIGLSEWTTNSSDTLAAWRSSQLYLTGVFSLVKATPEAFTFTAVPVNSLLDDNTLWSDSGDLEVVYRSTGTETIIQPTLVTKSITENGTYNAASDNADGYSSVTVNVSGGGGNTPEATQTMICDNSALGSTLTFTDDYENYDLIKFIVYRSDIGNQFTFYMTPAMINAMAQYSSNRINFNQPYGNNFVCYTKTSNTAWTRYGVRNLTVKYVYGLTFTNCTVTETELYNRQGIGSSNVTFTPPTGETFFDYDYILLATCTGNNDETQVNLDVFQPDIEKDIFGSDNSDENSVRVYKYNQGGTFVTVTESTITAFSYFYVCGLKLSYNQQNLLGGFNSNSEPEIESENSNDNEEDPINE